MGIERPKVTPEMIAEAAQKLAKDNGWDADQAADIAACFEPGMDGYQLARELDQQRCWSIAAMDVDTLDCMHSEVSEIHRAACMAWARENDIQPPLPIGTMTTRGEITGLYEHDAACYLVRETGDTDPSRRLIVRYEDARVAPVAAPSAT